MNICNSNWTTSQTTLYSTTIWGVNSKEWVYLHRNLPRHVRTSSSRNTSPVATQKMTKQSMIQAEPGYSRFLDAWLAPSNCFFVRRLFWCKICWKRTCRPPQGCSNQNLKYFKRLGWKIIPCTESILGLWETRSAPLNANLCRRPKYLQQQKTTQATGPSLPPHQNYLRRQRPIYRAKGHVINLESSR